MDVLTCEQRTRNMRAIRGRDTGPEMIVRRLIHGMGFRFRLQRRELAGRPDLVLPRLRAAIFVHGCFWHRHRCTFGRVEPASHAKFWRAKFSANVARDRRVVLALRKAGWRVLVVWECQTRKATHLIPKIAGFLERGAE